MAAVQENVTRVIALSENAKLARWIVDGLYPENQRTLLKQYRNSDLIPINDADMKALYADLNLGVVA